MKIQRLSPRLGRAAAALLCLVSVPALAAPLVYGETATVKVLPLTPAHANNGVGVAGARNEFVSFQVVVNGADTGAAAVSAALPPLAGPGSIGGTDITLYREALYPVVTPTPPNTQTGQWPDGLIPAVDEIAGEGRSAFPFDVAAGQAQALWVDIHIPANAVAGVYDGAVAITGGVTASVPVTLTVIDADMPSTPTLTTAFQIFAGNVCAAHTGASDCASPATEVALLGRYEQMALEHRITLTNLFVNAPAGGDWTSFDQLYGPWLNGSGPGRLAGAQMTTAEYTWARDASSYASFAQHFQTNGWFGKVFDYSGDEPPYGVSWSQAAANAAIARQGMAGFSTMVTTTVDQAQANGLMGEVNILTPVINGIDGTAAPYDGDQKASYLPFLGQPGDKLWLYQSCMSHGCAYGTNAGTGASANWASYAIDASAAKNRAMEWITWNEGGSGELYYETAMSLPTAWTNQFQFNGNGDGNLFYPGTPGAIGGSTDVPVASVRLKQIRQGVQDYEWLHMVSAAGDPDFANQVALGVVPAASQVSDNGSSFDEARLQLISRWLQLQNKQPAPQVVGAPPAAPGPDVVSIIWTALDPVTSGQPASDQSSSADATKTGAVRGGCTSTDGTTLAGVVGVLLGLARRWTRP